MRTELNGELLDKVTLPAGEASGLPNQVYTDHAFFLRERDEVLANTWVGICFGSDLPKAGYAKPVDLMGLPLLVVRDKKGEIRVFHNVCSHRGMLLVEEETAIKTVISCRYHSWGYELDGTLKSTPHIGGVDIHTCAGFDKSAHGLKPVRAGVWLDVVFVNLSGTAEPFADYIAPVVKRWTEFVGEDGFDDLFPASTGSHLDLPVRSNWKLPVENYCESYHLPWVHPGLNSYSPLDKHYPILDGETISGQGTLNYTPTVVASETLPAIKAWPEEKINHAEYLSLYPNVLLGLQADHAYAILLLPRGPQDTLEKLQILYVGEESTSDKYRECREAVLAIWKDVFIEDVFAVEGMQQGRESPGFCGGVFTPIQDTPTHHFHTWVANRYRAVI